jgi:hypothetical protein
MATSECSGLSAMTASVKSKTGFADRQSYISLHAKIPDLHAQHGDLLATEFSSFVALRKQK